MLTVNLTGPQTNGLLQECDTVVGTGSPVRGKNLARKILANHYSWMSYGKIVFVVEQYNNKLCGSGAVYNCVTIVHRVGTEKSNFSDNHLILAIEKHWMTSRKSRL